MHGLINRALQWFFCSTYGEERWKAVTMAAGLDFTDFEPMLIYDEDMSLRVLDEVCAELDRPVAEVLEDLGTFLVSNAETGSLRRLLRFGGVTFLEFLHSLDDLPDRVRLAVADLVLPALELKEHTGGQFSLSCSPGLPGIGSVMTGVLRAMADDYGALVLLDHNGVQAGREVISITLIETAYAEGRSFSLGVQAG